MHFVSPLLRLPCHPFLELCFKLGDTNIFVRDGMRPLPTERLQLSVLLFQCSKLVLELEYAFFLFSLDKE